MISPLRKDRSSHKIELLGIDNFKEVISMLLKEKSVGRPYIITVGVIVMLLVWFVARAFPQSTVVQNEIAKSVL